MDSYSFVAQVCLYLLLMTSTMLYDVKTLHVGLFVVKCPFKHILDVLIHGNHT